LTFGSFFCNPDGKLPFFTMTMEPRSNASNTVVMTKPGFILGITCGGLRNSASCVFGDIFGTFKQGITVTAGLTQNALSNVEGSKYFAP
jgi:hypothetical protein